MLIRKQVRQCTYNVTFRHFRATIIAVEKSRNIKYSECVPASLCIQHAMRMRRYYIVVCGLSGSTKFFHVIKYTARYSKDTLLNIKCVL